MRATKIARALTGTTLAGILLLGTSGSAEAADPRPEQWPLSAFDADAIWKVSTGKGITVAVIDSGFLHTHQDLKGALLPGKDFGNGEKDGTDSVAPGDAPGQHGTMMAGIIAGRGHGKGGEMGIKGLAPEAKILPLITELKDTNSSEQLAKAIRYAVDHGAQVINMSLVGVEGASAYEAIEYAVQKDVVLVAGSGNDGAPLKEYPASYPGVIGVGAVDKYGEVWDSSNFNDSVDLLGPGVDIVSTGAKSDSAYSIGDGTSAGTAYVSAAVALLRAEFPDLTAGQIVNRLVKTAGLPESEKGAKLPDEYYGHGFIQPHAALTKDIPAGPEEGPLPMPDPAETPAGTAGKNESAAGESNDGFPTGTVVGVVAGAAVLVGLLVLLIVKSSRRRSSAVAGPTGWNQGQRQQQAPHGQQPYGQQPPHHNPGGFPPQQQGPNQNQPSGPWGP
ncbi:S8 family serine peptidase [Streptomyces sp. HB2AG]|uniref:S8 family serine peptidase n=1 Tax=Streptomyces sp. HB2AG TaxID=2983400 RepID=UPI0022AA8752|nr:S8 family serine peptidase [Streptomyces sp. HB2AG]MCZ2526220.1 S8 family serine peptidase [Streptomyces sp. HB2AG]